MATTTPNFGWSVPTSTDLVKDGATAIETLGDAIDASLLDLKGGTTGQVLSKNSNTAMDFTWVAQDDSNAIQNALLTTTGDTIYASATSTPARLGIGTTGQVLTVSAGIPSWTTPASPNLTIAQIATGSMTGTTVTISSLSSYDTLYIRLENISNSTESQDIFRINASSSTVYDYVYTGGLNYSAFNNSAFTRNSDSAGTYFQISGIDESASSTEGNAHIILTNCKNSGFTKYQCLAYGQRNDSGTNRVFTSSVSGIFKSAAAVSSISITQASGAGSFDAGTYTVWGA